MTPSHAAFYGSLRQDIYDAQAPRLDGLGRFVGPCLLAGRLVDHGDYPGYFEAPGPAEPGTVRADLVEILDFDRFFAVFDDWEDYRPDAPDASLYVRRILPLASPGGTAWVYVSNQSAEDPTVPHGDWARHLRARATG